MFNKSELVYQSEENSKLTSWCLSVIDTLLKNRNNLDFSGHVGAVGCARDEAADDFVVRANGNPEENAAVPVLRGGCLIGISRRLPDCVQKILKGVNR